MEERKLSIYEKTEIDGPATKRHKKQVWIAYAVFIVLGLLPTIFKMSWAWRVFGAGLIVPGGGFLAMGGVSGVIFFLLTFLVYWFNLDTKLVKKLFPVFTKHYDNMERDKRL